MPNRTKLVCFRQFAQFPSRVCADTVFALTGTHDLPPRVALDAAAAGAARRRWRIRFKQVIISKQVLSNTLGAYFSCVIRTIITGPEAAAAASPSSVTLCR